MTLEVSRYAHPRSRATRRDTPPLRNDYTLVVMSKAGEPILFDRDCTEVVRVTGSPQTDTARDDARRALARYFVVPAVQVLSAGRIVREEFVEGEAFLHAGPEPRARVVDQLLQRYESLTDCEARRAPAGFWAGAVAAVRALDLPPTMREGLAQLDQSFVDRAREIPFAPAHGDLSGSNLFVNARGGAFIDMDDCDFFPAFFDLFFLAHQEFLRGRDDVWQRLVAATDRNPIGRALGRLAAAGAVLDMRTWIWASFITECYMWRRKAGAQPLTGETLRAWWSPIHAAVDRPPAGARPRGPAGPPSGHTQTDTASNYNG